jgi:hypothetical protein
MKLKLNRSFIQDSDVKSALEQIESYVNVQPFLKGEFKFYSISITGAVTNYKFPHNLGFVPKDVLVTSVIGSSPTWNYSLFDATNLDITVAGTTVIRAFIGRYGEN